MFLSIIFFEKFIVYEGLERIEISRKNGSIDKEVERIYFNWEM